jgi:hypothetical protein
MVTEDYYNHFTPVLVANNKNGMRGDFVDGCQSPGIANPRLRWKVC